MGLGSHLGLGYLEYWMWWGSESWGSSTGPNCETSGPETSNR